MGTFSLVWHKKHRTTYYKFLERRSIKTQALASQLMRLVMKTFPCDGVMAVLNDTLLPRQSATAPGVAIRHEHSQGYDPKSTKFTFPKPHIEPASQPPPA
jgi:hypothetical protein